MLIAIEVDPEEYPIPADGRVSEEIEDGIKEYFYDVHGAKIKSIKTLRD